MNISKLRSLLYKAARTLGDIRAVEKHRVVPRIERRVAGRFMSRLLSRLFR